MKHLKKIFHTASVTKEDPYLKLHDYLLLHRATPHSTTKKSPAELLFNRKFITTLPDIRANPAAVRKDILEAREADAQEKENMKRIKDDKANVVQHSIKKGSKVLLRRKTTKHNSEYDPDPYVVTGVFGTQIEAVRGDKRRTRDSQHFKLLHTIKPRSYTLAREPKDTSTYQEDPDIGCSRGQSGTLQGAGGCSGQAEQAEQHREGQPQGQPGEWQQGEGAQQLQGQPGEGEREQGELAGGDRGQAASWPARAARETSGDSSGPLTMPEVSILPILRNNPNVIIAETPANRPARTRRPPVELYKADWGPSRGKRRK